MRLATILLFAYNQLLHTHKVLQALENINLAEDSDLFISYDGAKNSNNIELVNQYNIGLKNLKGYTLTFNQYSLPNDTCYSVILKTKQLLLNIMDELSKNQILTRQNFYHFLSKVILYLKNIHLSIISYISQEVIYLPLDFDLAPKDVNPITQFILRTQNNTTW